MPSAARAGDVVTATDTHVVLVPSPTGAVPTPVPLPFTGTLTRDVVASVQINGRAAATLGSVAVNSPPHVPAGGPFQRPPSNRGTVISASATVLIAGKGAARQGDRARTCNDPVDLPIGTVAGGSPDVRIG